MRLYLIRHPRPLVGAGICYGSTDLAVDGHEVERVSGALRQTLPANAALYSSPLQRCATLARRLGYQDCQLDPRLQEIDFGAWEMRAWDDIPRAEIDAWAADPVHYHPGGGDSVLHMTARVAHFLTDLVERGSANAVVVCHAGTIRLLTALQGGAAVAQAAHQAATTPHNIGYGATITLEF